MHSAQGMESLAQGLNPGSELKDCSQVVLRTPQLRSDLRHPRETCAMDVAIFAPTAELRMHPASAREGAHPSQGSDPPLARDLS